MSNEKQLIPQLRFSEFEDGFEKFEFSEIARRSKKSYNPNKDSENFPCIELESLTQETGRLIKTFDSINLKSNKTRFSKNEVLFGKLRPYLKKYLLTTFEGVCTSEIWVFQGQLVSNPFLYYLIQTDKFNFEANVSSGSKMPRTDWEYLSGIKFSIPNNSKEQQKIASFLTDVDAKITQLTKKKSLLEQYKKGIMQKIFNQELRFKDDGGNDFPKWNKSNIGNVFKSFKGKGIPKGVVINDGKNKCVLYGELYTTYKEVISKVVSSTNSEDGLKSEKGDLLIPSSTTTTGIDLANVTALNFDDVLLGGDIIVMRGKKEINNIFYAYYLSNFKKQQIASRAQGITIVHIYFNSIKDLEIDVPVIEEQTKIANFLSDIDVKIEALSTKIENTQTFKKGLLQQMFV